MKIKLSDHFTYGRLLRFTLPSVVMMVIASIYSVVDGLFVSNFAGKEALAAVNLVFPLAMALGSTALGLDGIWWALTISSILKGITFFLVCCMVFRKITPFLRPSD